MSYNEPIAIISDPHANLKALNAVLRDIILNRGIRTIFCLGDVVGYGANPVEVIDIFRNGWKNPDDGKVYKFAGISKGNHDELAGYLRQGAFTVDSLTGMLHIKKDAAETLDAAVKQMKDMGEEGEKRLDFLETLSVDPLQIREDAKGIHAFKNPFSGFMTYPMDLWLAKRYNIKDIEIIQDPKELFADPGIFDPETPVHFIGHAHLPYAYREDMQEEGVFLPTRVDIGEKLAQHKQVFVNRFYLKQGLKTLVNVGSVGQSRFETEEVLGRVKKAGFEPVLPAYYVVLYKNVIEFIELYYALPQQK